MNKLKSEVRQLGAITKLAKKQLELEAAVTKAEAALTSALKQLNHIRHDLLPEALEEAGLSKLTLASGHTVQLGTSYTCSLAGQYREPALAWLRAQGLDDIVSRNVIESFGPGDARELEQLRKVLRKAGVQFTEQEAINTNVFKALVRERIEAGEEVPLSDIGVSSVRQTSITTPKPRRR